MKCGIVEKRKGKLLPPCKVQLKDDKRPTYQCRVHCRAQLRGERKGRLCSNHHVKGKRGCRMHGGTKKVGLASPNRKTLEYSRYLPVLGPKLRSRFENAMRQSDALSLLPDIYMIDARLEELFGRNNGETAKSWADALKYFQQLAAAGSDEARAETLAQLGDVLIAGNQEQSDYAEASKLWEQRRRMVDSERRNRLEHSVHKGIVSQLIDALIKSVERNVKDVDARDRVGADIARFTGATVVTRNQADDAEDLGDIG